MNRLIPAISVTLLVTGVLILRHQASEHARLLETIAQLRREHAAVDRLHRENAALTPAPVAPSAAAESGQEEAELEHLRPALDKLRQQLDWQLQMNAALGPPKALAPGMTPIDKLINAGAANPTDAAQSFFWAVAQADPDAMARQIEFTDDARLKAQALFAQLSDAARAQFSSPEKIMAIYLTSKYGRATGYQLTATDVGSQSPDNGGWKVTLQTASGSQHDVAFAVHRTTGGWHEVITTGSVDEAARYLH